MTDAFSYQLKLDQIRDGQRVDLVAEEAERRAIAERLGLGAIDHLEAHVTLSRTGPLVRAEGRVAATLEQSCVVTGEPVAGHVDEPFTLLFMPEPEHTSPDEEIELGAQDCDVVFYDGLAIDLGGAVADTLALSLDPYPRSASADAALKEAGVMTEEQASPFAALAQLKRGESDRT
jgi:uncharacterized metal-binding protein YceD (DUF177 family)